MDHVLEHERRFSASILWALQRRYFDRAGPGAWSTGEVPSYATSNPVLATAYARVVLGFLRDTPIDARAPLYLVELGAGSGRFAFHVVRALERLTRGSALARAPWCYVLTDFTDANVRHWQRHPALRPLVERGRVDFARFDAATDDRVVLRGSGVELAAGGLANPLVVIANYVFDGLPHDLFDVQPGELAECVVTTVVPEPPADPGDPALFARMRFAFGRRPAGDAPYGDPELDGLLAEYRAQLAGTVVALPTVALGCLARLAALAGDRLLVLAADKGYHALDALRERPEPQLALHGSFSLPVNFHALGRFFERRGGRVLTCAFAQPALEVCGFVLDRAAPDHPETRLAFDAAMGDGGPEDLHVLRRALEAGPALTVDALLALVRLTGYDATVFARHLPALKRWIGALPPAVLAEVQEVVRRVWDEHYERGVAPDLAFELGVLLADAGDWAGAVPYYERSLAAFGPDASCLFNLGLCLFHLGRPAEALARFDQALALAPALEAAETMRRKLRPTRSV